ncbi:copper resistance protein CopC [Streptomyces phytohabitans]
MPLTTAPRPRTRARSRASARAGADVRSRIRVRERARGRVRARRDRALLGVLGLLAAVCALLLGTAAPASAHAALTGSDPADGAVVGSAPAEITLTFSEGVALSDDSVRVLAPDGERVDAGKVRDLGGGGSVEYGAALRDGLGDGTYTVAWKAVSADSHPVSGAFTFSVGAPSETSVDLPRQEAGGGTVGFLYDVGRYAAYAGFVLLVGGAVFVLACWPGGARERAVRRLVAAGWVTLTAATLAMLLLRHAYDEGGGPGDVFDLSGLRAVVDTKPGAALISRLLLLAAAALFVSVLFGTYARGAVDAERGPARDGAEGGPEGGSGSTASATGTVTVPEGAAGTTTPSTGGPEGETERKGNLRTGAEQRDLFFGLALGGAVVATGLAATWAMAEHASTGIQTSLAMPADVVHLLAVAAWLGGLAALLAALHGGAPVTADAVRRFSRVAFGSVVALVATGVYQSWRQVGTWSALVDTWYGQLLLVKVGLVAVLLGLGWFSRRWTARLATAPDAGTGTNAGAGAGTAAGPDAEPEPVAEPASDEVPEPVPATARADASSPAGVPDPVRAAQLARQRAAADTAHRRRVRDADPRRAGLRRSVLAEAAVAVVVLAVTTALTGAEPGRTAEATERAGGAPDGPAALTLPFDTGGPGGAGTAEVTVDPGRTGANLLEVHVTDRAGKPLTVPEVQVAFSLPAKDLGPLRSSPRSAGAGHWEATDVRLPVAGEWEVAVTVRTSDIDQVTETESVRIG